MHRALGLFAMAGLVGCGEDSPSRSDVRPPANVEMVSFQGGRIIGRGPACFPFTFVEKPRGELFFDGMNLVVPSFSIDRRVVTCREYERCIEAGRCPREGYECRAYVATALQPAASRYCEWRGAQLPTYPQWQRAVRGVNGMFGHPMRLEPGFDYFRHSDEHGELGSTHTSADGVEYALVTRIPEVTRDSECIPDPQTPFIFPLLVNLNTMDLFSVHASKEPGRFRCVLE